MIDERVGSAELDQLAETLSTPCRLGDYTLEGLIRKTSTALVFVASGGAFGSEEGVMKLTGREYAPLLERELGLLNWCEEADVSGIVRPVRAELEWVESGTIPDVSVAAILLPFLAGGDLVQLVGAQATRTGRLGPKLALDVGAHIGGVLRDLLQLPKPLVHRDVKPQNVLLPYPGAALSELTLIDLDASEELDIPLDAFATAPKDIAQRLVEDVNGYGELLYILATGREPPSEGSPNPQSGNQAFDSLVVNCLTSEAEGPGYVCLADNGLWRDLEKALEAEKIRKAAQDRSNGPLRHLLNRRSLAGVGAVLFISLLLAVASKVFAG